MAAGLIEGPSRRWDLVTLLLLVIGMLSFAFFILLEFHKRDPMVQMSLFKSRNFSGANISTFAMYGALSGFFFSLVIYLQTKVGFSSLAAGASLLPVTILLISLSALAGRLSTRYGPRLFMTLGPLLGALGIAMLYGLHSGSTYLAGVLPGILLFGLGMALTVAPLTTTVMTSVQEADSGIASGINNAVARVSGLIIIALLGLFGTAQSYRLAVLLCTFLAAGAGALSYIFIRNDTTSIV
jgi:predicted MFS family arabinose efflux permease